MKQYCRRLTIMFSIIHFSKCWSILTNFIYYPLEGHTHHLKKHCHRRNISLPSVPSHSSECTLSEIMLQLCLEHSTRNMKVCRKMEGICFPAQENSLLLLWFSLCILSNNMITPYALFCTSMACFPKYA